MIVEDIGFSGSRKGMSEYQFKQVHQVLVWWKENGATTVHHGDCLGADAEFHNLALELGFRVIIHPPTNPKARAFCYNPEKQVLMHLLPESPYIQRNKDIVNSCDLLIACPEGPEDLYPRSGTWATIRYAKSHSENFPMLIIQG